MNYELVKIWGKKTEEVLSHNFLQEKKIPWPVFRQRSIPTERPPLVGEVSANFC
jgi:hypothetical protein